MKLRRSVKFPRMAFFLTAIIDIVFLLLLFFVLSTNVVVQSGISVELPQSQFALGLQPNPVLVTITRAPANQIYLEETPISMENFRRELTEEFARDRSVIIKADTGASYGLIMAVANSALEAGHQVIMASSFPEETALGENLNDQSPNTDEQL